MTPRLMNLFRSPPALPSSLSQIRMSPSDSHNFTFLTRSTIKTKQTTTWEDGKEYPLVVVDVSIASHPFYTGRTKLLDTAGRVDRFNKKFQGTYGKAKKGEEAPGS